MRRVLLAIAVAGSLAIGALPATGSPVVSATKDFSGPAHYSETAYPQTRPNAGQFCKRADRGVVTKVANGRRVRCTAESSRSRWVYV